MDFNEMPFCFTIAANRRTDGPFGNGRRLKATSASVQAHRVAAAVLIALLWLPAPAAAVNSTVAVDFADVVLPTDPSHTHLNASGVPVGNFWNGSDQSGGFTSGGLYLPNAYTPSSGTSYSWKGWSSSNVNDTAMAGYLNQFASSTGTGVSGAGDKYAVAYQALGDNLALSLPQATAVAGMYVSNTTYAYLSMKNGDGFARKFKAGDWFRLTIAGLDGNGQTTGTVEFYLADFRAGNTFLTNHWNWVNLSGLGNNVRQIDFSLSSSDVGRFGMNTPSYFALDNIAYVAPLTWTGTANGAWSQAANWDGESLSGSQAIAFSGTNSVTATNDLPPGVLLSSIAFTPSAAAFTLAGSGVRLAGNLTNRSNSQQSIALDIELVSGGGAMETVAGNVAISGRILGNQALVKSGSAALILSGSNSFTGGAVVLEGTLDLLGPSALPDGSALTIGNAAGVFAPVVTAPGIPSAGPAAVPEPGSLALLGSLAVTVVAWSCRRRSRSAP